MQEATDINHILDDLTATVGDVFKELLLAYTSIQLGRKALSSISDQACLETAVGLNITIEPIPFGELKRYGHKERSHYLLEVFHAKMVYLWQESITSIFCHFLELHFSGMRPFKELKKRRPQIDFGSREDMLTQMRTSLTQDFEFQSYAERVTLEIAS